MDQTPVTDAAAPPAPEASSPATALPGDAPGVCPVDHVALAAAARAEAEAQAASDAARCPVPHVAAAATAGCPVPHGRAPIQRSKADEFVRRLLRIKERPPGQSQMTAYAAFQKSMLISATRCTLTYVIFPFVLPAIGIAVQGLVGVVVGVVAMVSDVFTIRRFFMVDHKWRWYFSGLVFGIMCLLTALLVQDFSHLI